MTPPLCVVCHQQPVRTRRAGRPVKRGLRIIDGLSWNWFCSQRCAGKDCGRTNITSGRVQLAIKRAERARRRRAWERTVEEVRREVRLFMGYGVPKNVAIEALTGLVKAIRQRASDAVYHEQVRKPRRAAAKAAA